MKEHLTAVQKSSISIREWRLLELLRDIPYGEVTVFTQDNQPVRVEKVKESVKL